MDVRKLAQLEALLFTAGEPVELDRLAGIMDMKKAAVEEYLEVLKKEYARKAHGIEVKCYSNSYILASKTEYAPAIRELHNLSRKISLSKAALETLAIIAYRQPVTRAEIEDIRGVKAEKTLITLGKYELIRELGRKESIGNPIVYGTTDKFLEHFDLEDLSQLPDLEQFEGVESD